MPPLPRISGQQCIRTLEKLGFVQVRQRGSHVMMRLEDRGCVVPLHRELKLGTLSGLLKQGGVDPRRLFQSPAKVIPTHMLSLRGDLFFISFTRDSLRCIHGGRTVLVFRAVQA